MFGATGLTGAALVERLLADERVEEIVAPVRRQVPHLTGLSRVTAPLVDFEDLSTGLGGARAEQVFLCLGTTMAKAGGEAAFRRVDHDAVVAAGRAALEGGALHAFLISSVGASPSARTFYLRVKGEAEEAISALPFRSVHVFRPSLLLGARSDSRPGERLGMLLGSLLAPAMLGPLRRYRPIPAAAVAAAMAVAARDPWPGRWIHESEEIARLAAEA